MNQRSERYLLCASVAALALLNSGTRADPVTPSPAQGTPAALAPNNTTRNGITDVVVTAQRRSESLQKTSVVVTALSASTLTRNSITQAQSLTTILPGVQIGTAGSALQIYIRGVGDFGSTANSNPAVAFNIDGVYVGRSQSISSEFYDVSRVEVLKGPQGTLYGRNASGGAINLLTNRPTLGNYSGEIFTEVGNFGDKTIEGALNVPISPTLAARVSGTVVSKDGYSSVGYGDDKHQSGRLKLLYQPDSDVSFVLNGSYGHIGGKGTDYVLVNKVPGLKSQTPWTDAADPSVRAFELAALASTLPRIPGIVENPGPNDGFQDDSFYNISGELNADLGFAKLTVLPAYRDSSLFYTSSTLVRYQVGKAFGTLPQQPETSKQTSVEVRLANETPSFKWVVGGYFYNENQYSQFLTFNGLLANSGQTFTYDTRSYSGFGQATYSVLPHFRIIGGLRYTSDQRAIDGYKVNVAPTLSCRKPPGEVCPVESFVGNKTFSNLSFKGGIEADLGPQSLLFATISSGFKAGGFNTEIAPDATIPGSTAADEFRPEKLIAYETGIKNRFLNNRLQVNLEGFYWNYIDHQEPVVAISGSGNPGLVTVNAGKARSFGGSIDVIAKPWADGTFDANAEYDNSRYERFTLLQSAAFLFPGITGCKVQPSGLKPGPFGPILAVNCAGFQLTHAPTWSGAGGYTHVFSLGEKGRLEARGTLQFASQRWLSADFVPAGHAPAYVTLNASLTYVSPKGVTVTGFVRNISDAVVYQGGLQAPFQPGIFAANIAPPRTYGVQAGYRF